MFNFGGKGYNSLVELYSDNSKLVFVMTGDYTHDEHMRGDICSMVWSKVAENPQKYMSMDKCHVKNYLRLVVKTTACDYLKREEKETAKIKKLQETERYSKPCELDEEDFYSNELKYLEKARTILTEEEEFLICMRFKENISARQVGEILDISEGNVRVKQGRILHKLKNEIIRLMKEDEGR